ncbi:nickel transport system ATP-binding protein [Pseudomonas taetrolens]|uniref:Nickel ABC transporter ATP-binding protein n=1 Tax=Pseudomonas taetrolens TaxID=47884 RepID=A0A0J6JNZ2_PSETA|nr:ABC transporter ATP-binding protein [Pseudomonas taetrolens]KMM85532.1 nickel ABC transporter ATP-binding protein [Pseudomonas taetrolens]SEC23481.1 nickel transport system ATP-binding protein [Pseudomonas taetrolens]SQF86195.1 nickel transporter ATP-binding protein NikD [Pseudomonas taetrolens]VEH49271.1 nickel transporter ATP-binding protein NikD [Pseudomonas taetrolens]
MKQTLSIQGLSLKHQHHILVDRLDLTVRAGQVHALVGASGSGKSLSCLGILDLLPPGVHCSAGTLLLDGQPVQPARLRGREVALVLQNPRSAFNPVRSLRQHALETLETRGVRGAQAHALIAATLHEVGLHDAQRILDSFAFQLSGGMLQRLMIALALLADSHFLLADEPTSDLDVVAQARFLDLLERLVKQRHLGVLLITHDMGVVARCADQVSVMAQGRIVEQTDVHTLFNSPRSQEAHTLLAAHHALTREVCTP